MGDSSHGRTARPVFVVRPARWVVTGDNHNDEEDTPAAAPARRDATLSQSQPRRDPVAGHRYSTDLYAQREMPRPALDHAGGGSAPGDDPNRLWRAGPFGARSLSPLTGGIVRPARLRRLTGGVRCWWDHRVIEVKGRRPQRAKRRGGVLIFEK